MGSVIISGQVGVEFMLPNKMVPLVGVCSSGAADMFLQLDGALGFVMPSGRVSGQAP